MKDERHSTGISSPGGSEGGSERPLVSIITIFFNAERFLEEAIESVLAQTYDNWELLLVDDGSSDRSPAIANRYADRDPSRIRLLKHAAGDNRGMSASRNLGIAEARGEIIGFLDADDLYLPDKLSRQVELLGKNPEVGVVYGATLYWHSWTGRPEDALRDRMRRRRLPTNTLIRPPELFAPFLAGTARTPCTCGVLMRRAAVQAVGGFEERFRGLFEDQVFFCKLALTTPVYVEEGCTDWYRQHDDSSVSKARHSRNSRGNDLTRARADFVEWIAQYVEIHGVQDVAIRREVRKQLRRARYSAVYRSIGALQSVAVRMRARAGSLRRTLTDTLARP